MANLKMNDVFNKLYYSLDSPVAYSAKDKLFREARKQIKELKLCDVEKWLRSQPTYTLHRPVRLNFKTRRVVVYGMDEQWQMDLVDLSNLSRYNSGFKYILVCVDILSKYAWVVPLKTKSASELVTAIQTIFNKDQRQPQLLQTDKGTEFLNVKVKSLLHRHGVRLFTTNSERKASVVERLNRTLKGLMFKYFTQNDTRKYIDVLNELIIKYNNSYHSSIKMKPNEVTRANSPRVWLNLYEKGWNDEVEDKNALRVGDKVRISIEKTTFQKRYEQLWTEEIFSISHAINSNPIVYKIEDYSREAIKGTFYREELQKVNEPETYNIEKIIRKKRNADGTVSCLVRWRGYPEKFNSYVLEKDLV